MEMTKEFDKEIWRRVADMAGGRVEARPDGTLPLDDHLTAAMVEPRIAMMLMPRPPHPRFERKRIGQACFFGAAACRHATPAREQRGQ